MKRVVNQNITIHFFSPVYGIIVMTSQFSFERQPKIWDPSNKKFFFFIYIDSNRNKTALCSAMAGINPNRTEKLSTETHWNSKEIAYFGKCS